MDGYYQPQTPEGIKLFRETRNPHDLPLVHSEQDYLQMREAREQMKRIDKVLKGKPFNELFEEVQQLQEQKDDLRCQSDQCLVDKS